MGGAQCKGGCGRKPVRTINTSIQLRVRTVCICCRWVTGRGGGGEWEAQREQTAKQYRRDFRYSEYAGFPGGGAAYARFHARMGETEARREYERQMDEFRSRQRQQERGVEMGVEMMKKMLPVFLPVLAVLGLTFHEFNKKEKEKFKVLYDKDGNAFIEDAFGRVTRFQPYDRV